MIKTVYQASIIDETTIDDQESPTIKPYKFFQTNDTTYYEPNTTCPVAWEWVTDPSEADVIIFDMASPNPKTPADLQAARKHPEQKLVFYSLESGMHHPIVYDAKSKMGYDYVADYRIWPGHPQGQPDIPAVYLSNPTAPTFGTNFRKPVSWPKRTDALMVAFVTNCLMKKNERNRILEEIMKLIPVHSLGACYTNVEIPGWQDFELKNNQTISITGPERYQQKMELGSGYYFFFAAENVNEDSYVTEKIYEALETTAIPIYLGAPNVGKFVPHPSSYINVDDFNSTEALVDYMKALVADEEVYMKMHEWRKQEFSEDFQHVLRLASRSVHCRLAMKLAGQDYNEGLEQLRFFPP